MYRKTETTVANCAVAQDEATNVAKEEELRRLHDAHAMQTVGDKLFGDGNWEFASKSFANAIGYSEGEAGAVALHHPLGPRPWTTIGPSPNFTPARLSSLNLPLETRCWRMSPAAND